MDSDSSDAEEDMILLKGTRKRRHHLFVNRNVEGAYVVLINRHLIDNDTKFKEYFRLTPHLFQKLLNAITNDLQREPSIRYPEPIPPKLKLCLLLR